MKNSMFTAAFVLCFSAAGLHAQDRAPADSVGRVERKIDRIDQKIDNMGGKVEEIHQEIVASPLGNRKWGIEISPLYLLYFGEGGGIAGTVSNFSFNRSAELAFPFEFITNDEGSTMFNVDGQFRYFMSGRQRGFYVSGFGRFQHVKYQETMDLFFSDSTQTTTLNRVGIGVGIGSRIFSRKGFYWGWNLSAGKYIGGDKVGDGFPDFPSLWFGDVIIDMEFLKIGFAF